MPTLKELYRNRQVERMLGLSAMDFYGDEHLSPQQARERHNRDEIKMNEIRRNIIKNDVSLLVRRLCDNANSELDARLNDLRHLMNDQLIQLKYGRKDYPCRHDDEILIKW